MITDFNSDHGHLLIKLFNGNHILPEFVKEGAYTVDTKELDKLPEEAFADGFNREFPVYDPANTFVSAAYYFSNPVLKEARPDIGAKIFKAGGLFGIEEELERLTSRLAEHGKTATPEREWKIRVERDGNHVEISGNGAEGLKRAQDNFLEVVSAFPFNMRQEYARQLVKVAQEQNVPIKDDIYKFAGQGEPDENFDTYIKARAFCLPEGEHKVAFLKMADSLAQAEEKTPEDLSKFAQALYQFDEENRLTRFYGSRFPDPHRTVFALTHKQAEEKKVTIKIGEREYRPSELEHKKPLLKAALGEERFNQVAETDLTKLGSLTEEEANVVNQYLS